MQAIIPAPSTYSKLDKGPSLPSCQSSNDIAPHIKPYTWQKNQLDFKQVPIYCPREGRLGDDVTLYYPEFQKFIDDCESVTLKRNDLTFVEKLCTKMSESYQREKTRQNEFEELIKPYFLTSHVISQGNSIPDIYINPCSCVMIEVKNEVGLGGGDSHSQLIAYYVHSLTTKELAPEKLTTKELAKTGGLKPADRCPAPAFLLELVGPHLFISGAVYGKYVFVDRLVDPVWLVPHQREEAMIRIARIFKALQKAIGKIQMYYDLKATVSQPRFPIFQSFYKGNIQYDWVIEHHTFKGTLASSESVFVTFVKQYSCEAHELMDSHGYAPKLIHYEERVGGTQYTAIIRKYIDKFTTFDGFFDGQKEYVREHCTKALTVMHDHGFCHGKISSQSIFIEFQNDAIQIFIVNYEWAGKKGEARYPLSADIPEGVQPGDLITQEQDLAQLEKLFQ